MKILGPALLVMCSMGNIVLAGPPNTDSPTIKLMTWNIRYDNPADGINAWKHRKDWAGEIVVEQKIDIACFQEVVVGQLEDLKQRLPDMDVYGVGRNDGKTAGEFVPIFFRKDRLELLDKGTFWLSPTPEKPGSKGWDAAIVRIAGWIKLKDRQTEQTFYVVNTHFDHVGLESRNESARLLVKKLREQFVDHPVILAGDLNTLPNSEPYNLLTGKEQEAGLFFFDAYDRSEKIPEGPISTWNGFGEAVLNLRIDYVFTSNSVNVMRFSTLDDQREKRFPSDHFPIVTEVTISPQKN
jgi:endonuclease/exonuclease/phosphatase family metal-dependent hydrolase